MGDRALALVADRILLLALITVVIAWAGGGWFFDGSVFRSGMAIALSSLGFFLIVFLYHFLMELAAGTTAGKLLFGLRVVHEGERHAAAAFAIRNALRIVDGLALNLVGGLVAYFDRRVRRIGDLVGGTVVVQTPLKTGEKVALLITFLLVIGGALWLGTVLCPPCSGELQMAIRSGIYR